MNLLGRHVVRGPNDRAAAGHLRPDVAFEELGQPKVQNLGRLAIAALGDDDVLRLEVAVHDASRMRIGDGPGHLRAEIGHASEWHGPFFFENFGQIFAVHVLHHEVEGAGLRATEVEYMNRVGVVEAGRRLRFAMEASHVLRLLLKLSMQQLDGHHLADLGVLDAIHGAHRTASDRRDDPVALGDDVARLRQRRAERRSALPAELRFGRVALAAGCAQRRAIWRGTSHSTLDSGNQAKLRQGRRAPRARAAPSLFVESRGAARWRCRNGREPARDDSERLARRRRPVLRPAEVLDLTRTARLAPGRQLERSVRLAACRSSSFEACDRASALGAPMKSGWAEATAWAPGSERLRGAFLAEFLVPCVCEPVAEKMIDLAHDRPKGLGSRAHECVTGPGGPASDRGVRIRICRRTHRPTELQLHIGDNP